MLQITQLMDAVPHTFICICIPYVNHMVIRYLEYHMYIIWLSYGKTHGYYYCSICDHLIFIDKCTNIFLLFSLQLIDTKQLKKKTVEAIHVWIRTCLEPLECLWVNYYRLLIAGLNGRTTSIGEALHWATKGAFDGCNAAMSQATSANTQMTQAERKVKKLQT